MRGPVAFVRCGLRASTIARRISDDLLRNPTTKPHAQFAVQPAAMGSVQFSSRPAICGVAQRAIDASDWWLWTRWLWIGAGSFWSAIRPIWRHALPPALWIHTQ